jgi:predicted ABC-type ATPase
LNQRRGIAFETVFSHESKVEFIVDAKSAGYFVRLFFVGTESPEINIRRVNQRVSRGGHDVPIDKIRSRYGKSLANLAPAIALVDRAYVFDNSVDLEEAILFAKTSDGVLKKSYATIPKWAEPILAALPTQ